MEMVDQKFQIEIKKETLKNTPMVASPMSQSIPKNLLDVFFSFTVIDKLYLRKNFILLKAEWSERLGIVTKTRTHIYIYKFK